MYLSSEYIMCFKIMLDHKTSLPHRVPRGDRSPPGAEPLFRQQILFICRLRCCSSIGRSSRSPTAYRRWPIPCTIHLLVYISKEDSFHMMFALFCTLLLSFQSLLISVTFMFVCPDLFSDLLPGNN
jgi:hypothetical protein